MGFESPNVISFEKHRKTIRYDEYLARKRAKYELEGTDDKGHRYEKIVLGECVISQVEDINVSSSKTEAIEFAMAHQPEEKSGAIQWIEQQMMSHLNEADSVEMFTAVGSPLDYDFGADAVIRAGGQYFTVDYTIGSKKHKEKIDKGVKRRADMIFQLDLDIEEEKKLEAINNFSNYAAGYIDSALKTIREYQEEQRGEYAKRFAN